MNSPYIGHRENFADICPMEIVYLLLGSNRGDRYEYLSRAAARIGQLAGNVLKASSVFETSCWGFKDETPFLNQVLGIETTLEPMLLLDILLGIESELGRIRIVTGAGCGCGNFSDTGADGEASYLPRTIDIDILFYGSRLVFDDILMIPHPRLHLRRFTLVPLAEIAPGFLHPVLKKSISDLLRECPDKGLVSRIEM
jgi:2-amino-4-hydroxy-6-hydroxymethyldihydropteridine diphosphokinase